MSPPFQHGHFDSLLDTVKLSRNLEGTENYNLPVYYCLYLPDHLTHTPTFAISSHQIWSPSLTSFLDFTFSSVCIIFIIQTNFKREKIGNKNFNTHPLFHQNTFKHLGTKRWNFSKPEVWMCRVADVGRAVAATIFTQLSWTGSPFNVICT